MEKILSHLSKSYDIVAKQRDELVKELEEMKSNFYMNICRAYNAGKKCMNNQHKDVKDGKDFNNSFVSSHNYFINEFPNFKTNVP